MPQRAAHRTHKSPEWVRSKHRAPPLPSPQTSTTTSELEVERSSSHHSASTVVCTWMRYTKLFAGAGVPAPTTSPTAGGGCNAAVRERRRRLSNGMAGIDPRTVANSAATAKREQDDHGESDQGESQQAVRKKLRQQAAKG